jgi:hypothetical protein
VRSPWAIVMKNDESRHSWNTLLLLEIPTLI